MHPTNCQNCGLTLANGQQFCSQCGQKANIHRFSFHELFHELVHYFTHADKGIFHLLRSLATKPGVVAREYLSGARKRYFSPLNFFFIVAGILVFMTSIFYKVDESRVKDIEAEAMQIKDPVKQKRKLEVAERIRNTTKYTSKYSNIINMIATPLVTVFFWLFYRRKYNYVEHLVANMYFVGFTMLIYSLVFVPLLKLPLPGIVVFGLLLIFFLFEIIYRSIAYYQFNNRKGALAYFKALAVSVLVVLFWAGGTFYVISYYIRHGF